MIGMCFNRLTVTGPDIPRLLGRIGTQDLVFSNRIIPMPESLKIAHGRKEEFVIAAVTNDSPEKFFQILELIIACSAKSSLAKICMTKLIDNLMYKDERCALYEGMYDALEKGLQYYDFYPDSLCDRKHNLTFLGCVSIGYRYLQNLLDHEFLDGYYRIIYHWDTKRDLDAYKIAIVLQKRRKFVIEFMTVWSTPIPVIKKMGRLFQDYKFQLTWEEEGFRDRGQLITRGNAVKFQNW